MNQCLGNHGFGVLSANYRLGIGYGEKFHHLKHWGVTGTSEYKDVLAGARWLRRRKSVARNAISIWVGSYGY